MQKLLNRLYALGIVSGVVLYALLVCLVLAAPAVYIGVKAYIHSHVGSEAVQHVDAHGMNVKHTHGKGSR